MTGADENDYMGAIRVGRLARDKGYLAEPALVRGRWRLIDERTGDPVRGESGTIVFTLAPAIRFLTDAPLEKR